MSVFFYLFTDCFFLKRSVFFFLCEFPMNLGYLFGFTYVSHSLLSFSFFSWFSDFFFFFKNRRMYFGIFSTVYWVGEKWRKIFAIFDIFYISWCSWCFTSKFDCFPAIISCFYHFCHFTTIFLGSSNFFLSYQSDGRMIAFSTYFRLFIAYEKKN